MQKNIIIILLLIILLGCKEKAIEKDQAELKADSLSQASNTKEIINTQMFIDPETGDTIYVDFIVDYNDLESTKEYKKYYIVSSYSSFKKDAKFEEEFARWKKLEPECFIEEFRIGQGVKYYISLGKYDTQAEVVSVFEDFKTKYPQEKINYQLISQ